MKDDYNQLTEFIQLIKRIDPNTILPSTRGYAGSPDFLNVILNKIQETKPNLIVEASCGVSSIVISDYLQKSNNNCSHIAFEHDEIYLKKCRKKINNKNSKILHTPLKKYNIKNREWIWYNFLGTKLETKIDLLIIDGPPAYLQDNSRYPALPLLKDQLSPDCVIIMDDFNRKQEQKIIDLWKNEFNISVEVISTEKGTGIITLKKGL